MSDVTDLSAIEGAFLNQLAHELGLRPLQGSVSITQGSTKNSIRVSWTFYAASETDATTIESRFKQLSAEEEKKFLKNAMEGSSLKVNEVPWSSVTMENEAIQQQEVDLNSAAKTQIMTGAITVIITLVLNLNAV